MRIKGKGLRLQEGGNMVFDLQGYYQASMYITEVHVNIHDWNLCFINVWTEVADGITLSRMFCC